jgi:hypothetical protein
MTTSEGDAEQGVDQVADMSGRIGVRRLVGKGTFGPHLDGAERPWRVEIIGQTLPDRGQQTTAIGPGVEGDSLPPPGETSLGLVECRGRPIPVTAVMVGE